MILVYGFAKVKRRSPLVLRKPVQTWATLVCDIRQLLSLKSSPSNRSFLDRL
jgi:hypothetical protein